MNRKNIHQQIFNGTSVALAACIPFSERICTFILIGMAVNWLTGGNFIHKIKTAYHQVFVILCSSFYLLEVAGLFYTHHFSHGFYHAQTEASFFVIPLLFFSYGKINKKLVNNILGTFCFAVFLTSLYCVITGTIHYTQSGDISSLFFKDLVSPIHQHPVYFSVYTFICIVYLLSSINRSVSSKKIFLLLGALIYFSLLLFLLRSKIVVAVIFIYAVYQLVSTLVYRKGSLRFIALYHLWLISMILTVLATSNPFSKEVNLLYVTDWSKMYETRFNSNDRFGDIGIRLTLEKFGIKILNESHAWIFGVSPGDAQNDVNLKIISSGMFTGYPGTDDHGFINYNLHDQYLQTLLNSGIVGLILLLGIFLAAYKKSYENKDTVLFFTLFVFTSFFLTESVLERQMGIVPFFFFVSILILQEGPSDEKHQDKKKKHEQILENIC